MFRRRIHEATISVDKAVVQLGIVNAEDRACSSDLVVRVLDGTRPGAIDELDVVVM